MPENSSAGNGIAGQAAFRAEAQPGLEVWGQGALWRFEPVWLEFPTPDYAAPKHEQSVRQGGWKALVRVSRQSAIRCPGLQGAGKRFTARLRS